MKNYFIPNIDKIVEAKLKELKLKPELSLSDLKRKRKRFYSTPCQTEDGKTVFLKILISKRKEDAAWLKKEIAIGKTLQFNSLSPIKENTKKMPFWFLRQYLPGPIVGYHFKIYRPGLKKQTRKEIVKILLSLQSLSPKIKLEKKEMADYLKSIKSFEEKLKVKRDKSINFEKIYQFFESQKKYFKKQRKVLAHGDFTLANFFVNERRVYLTDWEHLRYDNIAADIARLWIQTYKYPKWRKSLVLLFLAKVPKYKREQFQQLFRVMAINEAVAEFTCDVYTTPKKNAFKKSMLKTIESAIKGFDYLIKT